MAIKERLGQVVSFNVPGEGERNEVDRSRLDMVARFEMVGQSARRARAGHSARRRPPEEGRTSEGCNVRNDPCDGRDRGRLENDSGSGNQRPGGNDGSSAGNDIGTRREAEHSHVRIPVRARVRRR